MNMMTTPITGPQVKAARALVGLTQDELAVASGLTPRIIQNAEAVRGSLHDGRRKAVVRCITTALADAGVEFTEGQGVRLRGAGQ